MRKTSYEIMPATQEILSTMGMQIKMARLRRNLSVELVAERAGISRAMLWNVEKGSPSVAIGIAFKESVEDYLAQVFSDAEYEMFENKMNMKSVPGYQDRLRKAL